MIHEMMSERKDKRGKGESMERFVLAISIYLIYVFVDATCFFCLCLAKNGSSSSLIQ